MNIHVFVLMSALLKMFTNRIKCVVKELAINFNLSKCRLFIFHVIVPLCFGGVIYVAFRSNTLILNGWINEINLSEYMNIIRNLFYPIKCILPNWIIYSLPDGLWVYSLTSAIFLIWGNSFLTLNIWLVIILLIAPLIEFMQYFGIFPGTFDLIDLLFYLIGSFLSLLIIKLKLQNYEKKKL